MPKKDSSALSRRQLLVAAGSGLLVAAGVAAAPRAAHAGLAEADETVKKLIGGAAIKEGRVTFKQLPPIAENGNTVPFTVSVESPMTDGDYVKSVYIISEGNPFPHVATFNFTPASGKAEVSMRMRMAKTQYLRAVATMSDGSVYQTKQEVKVTIGGCGG